MFFSHVNSFLGIKNDFFFFGLTYIWEQKFASVWILNKGKKKAGTPLFNNLEE